MTKTELIIKMKYIKSNSGDCEADHSKLDDLLLEYINNKEVTEIFNSIEKWYA